MLYCCNQFEILKGVLLRFLVDLMKFLGLKSLKTGSLV